MIHGVLVYRVHLIRGFKDNVCTKTIGEYVGIMKVHGCYACAYHPTSAVDGSTYVKLPISYSLSFSVFGDICNKD